MLSLGVKTWSFSSKLQTETEECCRERKLELTGWRSSICNCILGKNSHHRIRRSVFYFFIFFGVCWRVSWKWLKENWREEEGERVRWSWLESVMKWVHFIFDLFNQNIFNINVIRWTKICMVVQSIILYYYCDLYFIWFRQLNIN